MGAALRPEGAAPRTGHRPDVHHGESAARMCLEKPGLDTLDILVLWKGFPTYASTQTLFTILTSKRSALAVGNPSWPLREVQP
ncbi:MAG TPA: DUF5938 domain-containing protein [Archangium sp.]|nr:DUF5938 domain-containing protein [Archangium sp.]